MNHLYRTSARQSALLCILIFIAAVLTGCGAPQKKDYLSDHRITAWKNDVDYMMKVLPKLHKNPYFSITEDEFMRNVSDLKKKAEYYSDKQMEIAFAETVASLGDTHTGSRISTERMYPFELHWYAEGIYIMSTDEEHKEFLHTRIISINGMQSEEAAQRIKPVLAGANSSWFKTQSVYYLIIPEVLKYFGISQTDNVSLEIELLNGESRIINVEPVSYNDYQPAEAPELKTALYRSRPAEKYWYEYIKEEKTIYLNYNTCRQMRDLPFEVFNKEFWSFTANADAQQLVIDLRSNRGGSSVIFEPFIRKLKDSQFNSKGRLWVIIGKDTFSSAILNAISLKKQTEAVFIGENTGGEPNHYGEVKEFKLPNSGISIHYSTKYFHWYDADVNTLKPEIYIEESFDSHIKGKDPVLEYLLAESPKK